MKVSAELERLAGAWQGTNLLWLSEQPIESETTATVRTAAGGTCLCVEYVWNYEGEAQQGILLLGGQGGSAVRGIWRDSWHSSGEFLISDGELEGPSDVRIHGHYSAPPGPDWGWQTHLHAAHQDRFEITMTNVTPEGAETPAVRMEYSRREASAGDAAGRRAFYDGRRLHHAVGVVVSPAKASLWGRRAFGDDPDGYRVEL